MNLTGKTCLVTGANAGLGFAFSKRMAAEGVETILLCRDTKKGENAISKIKYEFPEARVELMICDLSSIKSIQNFIADFKMKFPKLDILYNNAAIMKRKRTLSEDGFEMMYQVNYLAPFLLMTSFLELLGKSSFSIIINNGRPSEKLRLDMDDLQFSGNYHMYQSFFKTKLCLLFATIELGRRLEGTNITITMIDPGPFKSDLVRDVPLMNWLKNLFSAPVDKAVDNLFYHLSSDDLKGRNGKVYKEKQEQSLTEYWNDRRISENLWSITEKEINISNV